MEKVAQEKSFLNLDEALTWLDQTIWDWGQSGWHYTEGTNLRYINYQWQVFITLERDR